MDQDEELARFKWILAVGIAVIVTGCYAFNEMKYALWGKSAAAKIMQVKEITSTGRRGRTRKLLRVEYEFSEASGTRRSERDEVSMDWSLPTDGTITVQFIPGVEHASRLEGHSSMIAVYLFFGCIAFLGIAIYRVSQYVNDTGGTSKKPRRG